ncbi:MAG: hypothetical protein OCD02_20965 [Spirochaetaceae bacterium]
MNKAKSYRVPDVIDKIYNDIVYGLFTPYVMISKKNRTSIIKCNLACEILLNSNNTEFNIVEKLDYPSVDVFRDSFKDFLGILPLEFRDRFSD